MTTQAPPVDPAKYSSPETYWLAKWHAIPRDERRAMRNLRSAEWTAQAIAEWDAAHA